MDLPTLKKNWDDFGTTDPLWAILTDPTKKGGKWDLDEFLRTGKQEIADVFERLKSLRLSVASNRALDFGCGIGRSTQALSSRFDECWGVDIAPSMIAFAKRINAYADRCHYHLNDKNDLAFFPSQHFDFIYSRLVLQHMDPGYAKRYIKEFLRILAPQGVLVFQIPDGHVQPLIDKNFRGSQSTGALPPDAFNAGIVCIPPATTVEAGSLIRVPVTVRNLSKTVWPSIGRPDGMYFVRLGNHWLDRDLNLLVNDDARVDLHRDLQPGETAELVLNVTAPSSPGSYDLELDMVQEGVAWFAQRGSKTARIAFRVVASQRGPQTTAVMEMHAVPKQEVIQIIGNGGGEIVDIISDDCAGPEWVSFSYYVKKQERQSVLDRPETHHLTRSSSRTQAPFCSILIVNFNGKKYLDACLRSFESMEYPAGRFEIVVVDNGSDDGSDRAAQLRHPDVRILYNPKNNYAAALNLGVKSSQGDYVAFCNNDVFMERHWLKELVSALEENPSAGCAAGKILLEDGRINSVGHRALPEFYWVDAGYGEQDAGQYQEAGEVDSVCWAAVLFRRACLQDLGPIDEDYVMYYEDVDTSKLCRQRGWAILYQPRAVTRHVFHGSSGSAFFAEFFSDRSRLIYVAKHHPDRLAEAIRTSRYLMRGEGEALYDAMLATLKKLVESHAASVVNDALEAVTEALAPLFGALAVDHLFARLQVILGHRKMSIGFYDHAVHMIGGGQKYGCTMASALNERYDVTLLSNQPVRIADLEQWYRIPLSGMKNEVVPLPYFVIHQGFIDATRAPSDGPNPFEAVSGVSQQFDVFVNVNMLAMVEARSPFSVFVCHFPDAVHPLNFSVDEYTCMVVNSRYTLSWTRARWGLEPAFVLYPPVDMGDDPAPKDRIILSTARFERAGSKKQGELIGAFERLCEQQPELMRQWRLVLVGGSVPDNPYLREVERAAAKSSVPVEIHVNVPFGELQSHYSRARIFWHACGLGQSEPQLIEHFGMTTVEAMQNRCIPIVINGGGQKEIVEQGVSGYRFNTIEELCARTQQVIASPDLAERLSEAAFERGRQFSRARFDAFVKQFFSAIEQEYRTVPIPNPRDIVNNRRPENLFYSPLARRQFTASPAPVSRVPR